MHTVMQDANLFYIGFKNDPHYKAKLLVPILMKIYKTMKELKTRFHCCNTVFTVQSIIILCYYQ